jgi:uncharacterized spore protein YtfJ
MKEQSEKIQQYLRDFIPQLKDFVQSETIFGDPVKLEEVTLIPVHSVKVGFGFGDADKKNAGGGGVVLTPVAFVVIQKGIVTIQTMESGNIEGLLEKIPNFLERSYAFVEKVMKKDKKDKD